MIMVMITTITILMLTRCQSSDQICMTFSTFRSDSVQHLVNSIQTTCQNRETIFKDAGLDSIVIQHIFRNYIKIMKVDDT